MNRIKDWSTFFNFRLFDIALNKKKILNLIKVNEEKDLNLYFVI